MADFSAEDMHHSEDWLSSRWFFRSVLAVAALALVSLSLTLFGGRLSALLDTATYSETTSPHWVTIGLDRLAVEENAFRFARQRQDGAASRLDLVVSWPEMTGFSAETRLRFTDPAQAPGLLFLQLTQSVMSRDMSGRMGPIYAQLFEGAEEAGPFGLTIHRFRKGAGYDGEIMYSAPRPGQPDYAVRCIDAANGAFQITADCQRDLHLGRDLTVLYRFSSRHLQEWRAIDEAVQRYVTARLKP
ncbi:hypothetical protein [Rhizobium paknamense]|uniref:Transmembrane anchored protein n=1 Tax=Rhizobium paknamense TaxID=1206817 RepID=A0ABU0IEA8_9HYPH|nr:hypothetical protein [Rhizobium paknamense]MDQ0455978.1 hypothetical protein [Rhizobium paknamense]